MGTVETVENVTVESVFKTIGALIMNDTEIDICEARELPPEAGETPGAPPDDCVDDCCGETTTTGAATD